MNAPGTIAYMALALWVPISFAAFMLMRPDRAAIFTVLGALLFLPEGVHYKFPLTPPLTKENIPYLCVFAAAALRTPSRLFRLPKEKWFIALTLALLGGAVGTALTNRDTLSYGTLQVIVIPPLTVKDGFYTGIDQSLHAALPFFLGLAMFRTPKDLVNLLASFAIGGLVYVPFALVEMRMSPQFHNWVYGYQQHSFLQTIRWGGYRPMVFMAHGLSLARFFVVGMLSALVIAKSRRTLLGLPSRLVSVVLFVTLIACKSTGAVAYGGFGLLVTLWGRARLRTTIAVVLAAFVVLYPALRASGVFPVGRMLDAAGLVDADRQQSLLFRFENEDTLLSKARERIVFGWGEYNRSGTFDDLGRLDSVTDGHWIVLFGVLGVVGFVSTFGILLIPVFLARRRLRRIALASDKMLISGTSLIVALVAFDLIPNGLWADYPYLLAGALAGVSKALATARRRAVKETPPSELPVGAPIPAL